MNAFGATRWIAVLAFGLLCLHCGHAVAANGVQICNNGNVTVKTALVETTNPFFSGTNYNVVGWYNVEPGECNQPTFGSPLVLGTYLGFAYRDIGNVLRAHIAMPQAGNYTQSAAVPFCVATDMAFEYTTKTKPTSCGAGYALLTFSLFIDSSDPTLGLTTYTVTPDEDEFGDPLEDSSKQGPTASARLIFGDEVALYGNQWRFSNGSAVPASLIDQKSGRPPLLPRQQYSASQEPVAGYLKQLKALFASFQACTAKIAVYDAVISAPFFNLDDYGTVVSAYRSTFGSTNSSFGAAIANLDLANPRLIEQGVGCITVIFTCKSGECVRSGDNADSEWRTYVNSHDEADILVRALRAIVSHYPDGSGEIRSVK